MTNLRDDIALIEQENLLQKKTGIGGLPQSVIDNAQKSIELIQLNYSEYASKQIHHMKACIKSDSFMTAQNDNTIDNFLFHLVPFHITMKLANSTAVTELSNLFLKFVESLPFVNVDANHVMNVFLNAIEITIQKNINDNKHPVIYLLSKELNEATDRYYLKYKSHTGIHQNIATE